MQTKSISIRVDEDLLKYLTERAEKEHRTLSNLIISILIDEKKGNRISRQDAIEAFSDMRDGYAKTNGDLYSDSTIVKVLKELI